MGKRNKTKQNKTADRSRKTGAERRGLRLHSPSPPHSGGRWKVQPETSRMRKTKTNTGTTMQKYMKSPDQKQNDKQPEINPEDTEIHKLNDRDFKIAIIKTLNEIRDNTDKQFNEIRSFFTKEIEIIKKNQSVLMEMKNTMEEIKENLESLKNRADNMEERISTLEDRNTDILQMEEERELRLKRNEERLREISDSIRKCNIRIIGIPEGEERERGTESLFKEIIAENFPNLGKEQEIPVSEANRTPIYINRQRPSPRHLVVRLARVNDKETILRAARQKQKITYKGTPIRLSADFSTETFQARRDWNDIFKILKDKNFQPRILYPAKISFKYDGEIVTLPDKQKLREFMATRPPLQEILKKALRPENKKRKGTQSLE